MSESIHHIYKRSLYIAHLQYRVPHSLPCSHHRSCEFQYQKMLMFHPVSMLLFELYTCSSMCMKDLLFHLECLVRHQLKACLWEHILQNRHVHS